MYTDMELSHMDKMKYILISPPTIFVIENSSLKHYYSALERSTELDGKYNRSWYDYIDFTWGK